MILSYLAGQLLFAAGAGLDDVYDKVYKTLRDERLRSVRCRSMKLLREFLQTEYRQPDNRHILATCYLTLREPNAVRVIERLDADSKFFRSLCALVLTVLTVLPMYGIGSRPGNPAHVGLAVSSMGIQMFCALENQLKGPMSEQRPR